MVIFFLISLAVIISIGIHYSVLLLTTALLSHFHSIHPLNIVLSLFFAVLAHLLEIVVFAIVWFIMYQQGLIEFSLATAAFIDVLYFSGTTYTTIGYGDIVIVGNGRVAAVVEGVMGLVLIAWTASFTYFEMNRKWVNRI